MKKIRLENYDYGTNGYYFVTICSYDKKCIFGFLNKNSDICRLSYIGRIIEEEIVNIENRYNCVKIDNYIVMPNHIHLIVIIDKKQEEYNNINLGEVICSLKSISTIRANKFDNVNGRKIWQARYHDHIIRGQEDYENIWNYIEYNTAKWHQDKYYIKD